MNTKQAEDWLLRDKYKGVKSPAFVADCRELKAGVPLGYVIGWVPFLNTKIYLDSKPLIPRPETEYWTEQAIKSIRTATSPSVLDLCAGSGCIGVAVFKVVPTARVDLAELDQKHLRTISRNIKANGCPPGNSRIIHSDLFATVNNKYDFILSNPPYLKSDLDKAELAVKAHEPTLALDGGKDGFCLLQKIITATPRYLKPKGQLWLEHEPEQATAVRDLGNHLGFSITTNQDQYGVKRYSVLMLL